jgi:uncharacterized membrane-anchored protein
MRKTIFLVAAFGMFAMPLAVIAQTPEAQLEQAKQLQALPWIEAPVRPKMTDKGTIALTPDVQFLDAKNADSFLKLTGNLPGGENYILFSKAMGWWADYSFSDIGYVKDDEKIDAAALLQDMKDGDAAQNEARKEQGLETMTTVGWAVPPHYDPASHNLEYGLILGTPSGNSINYHMRILGRRGVMDAVLVTSEQTLKADLEQFRAANKGFAFNTKESYASFKEGDRVSEYGLAALVGGGAVAAAVKTGLFAGLLKGLLAFSKFIIIGLIAGFAVFKNFFVRLFRKGRDLSEPSED